MELIIYASQCDFQRAARGWRRMQEPRGGRGGVASANSFSPKNWAIIVYKLSKLIGKTEKVLYLDVLVRH